MFTINFWNATAGWIEIAQISGCEAAYEAYKKACEFAELVGVDCDLVDIENGEVIACLGDEN